MENQEAEKAPDLSLHLVHMKSGESRTMTGDELNGLDPRLWDTAEPADRPRHIVMPALNGDAVEFHAVDRADTRQVIDPASAHTVHGTRAEAQAAALERNIRDGHLMPASTDHKAANPEVWGAHEDRRANDQAETQALLRSVADGTHVDQVIGKYAAEAHRKGASAKAIQALDRQLRKFWDAGALTDERGQAAVASAIRGDN